MSAASPATRSKAYAKPSRPIGPPLRTKCWKSKISRPWSLPYLGQDSSGQIQHFNLYPADSNPTSYK